MTTESTDSTASDGTQLLSRLRQLVGADNVLTHASATRRFRKGHRTGEGKVLAVVRPGTLLEQWQAVQAIVASGRIVLMQAANTGLTGGSTPDGNDYDREIVLINTMRITGVQVIRGGEQVVCLPGATLDRLEQTLAPLGREPHSVIGSSCIGASVLGGVCNNSGGALVRRGPAYTELALYARVREDGELELVNHLGIRLGDTPEEILTRLQSGDYQPEDIANDAGAASDPRPRASMPTPRDCTKRPALPGASACLRCAWIPSRANRARCSISAATTPTTSPRCAATC